MSSKSKVLIVGDSIAHNSNFRILEKATNTVIRTAKAYTADFDVNARKPNENFKYVARNTARTNKFKIVVMQSPAVDITNLHTNDNSADAVINYKKVVENSTRKMFEVAETIIEENKSVEKVIILDRTPRFDTQTEDPFGLKPKLATFGNELCRKILYIRIK